MFDSAQTLIPLAINMATCCLVGIWVLLDPFFYLGVEMLAIDLRLQPPSPFGDQGFHAFRKVGWRVLLLSCVTLSALGSAAFLLVSHLLQRPVLLGNVLPCWGIIGLLWLALLSFHRGLHRYGLLLRVRFVVRIARQIAGQLNASWPTTDGNLPWVGKYRVHVDTPNTLTVPESLRFPVWESCGPFIRRDASGIVRFDLVSRGDINLSIEVFFNGQLPRSYTDVFAGFSIQRRLEGSIPFRDNTFLTWYASDFVDLTAEGAETLCDVLGTLRSEMAKHGDGKCHQRREPADT